MKIILNRTQNHGTPETKSVQAVFDEIEYERRRKQYRVIAQHVCASLGIRPEKRNVATYLGSELHHTNAEAAEQWLLSNFPGPLKGDGKLSPNNCTDMFNSYLRKVMPEHTWGGDY